MKIKQWFKSTFRTEKARGRLVFGIIGMFFIGFIIVPLYIMDWKIGLFITGILVLTLIIFKLAFEAGGWIARGDNR